MKASGTKIHLPGNGVTILPAKARRKIPVGLVIALVLWLGVVGGATILMTRYSNTPGRGGAVPVVWPPDSQIPFDSSRPTLVMFAHPHCPCTRASLGELERLLAEVPGQLNAHLVILKPAGAAADWEKTDLWRKASSISGVSVITDHGGTETRRFHAETSGQTMLYDSPGRLRFQGGLTFARGHAGDNPGRSALRKLLREGHSNEVETPVFGCTLFEAQCANEDILCKR